MAIDITCHSFLGLEIVQEKVDFIKEKYFDFFDKAFLIYKVRPSTEIDKEIAQDFGFTSNVYFVIALNNKDRADEIPRVAQIIREEFNDAVLILFQNETEIKPQT